MYIYIDGLHFMLGTEVTSSVKCLNLMNTLLLCVLFSLRDVELRFVVNNIINITL